MQAMSPLSEVSCENCTHAQKFVYIQKDIGGIGLHHESWWDCIGLHYQSCWDCIGLHHQSCWDCIGLHYQSCWDCNGIAMGLNLGGITMRSDSVGLPKESQGQKYNSK